MRITELWRKITGSFTGLRNEEKMARYIPENEELRKDFWNGEPTDQELEQMGIEIPESETDQSFFDRINRIIQEEFGEEI